MNKKITIKQKKIKDFGLTPRQALFCELYASDREFFGNGTQSYIEAFNIDLTRKGAYIVAKVNASKELTKANVCKYIDSIFESRGLNDNYVDKQLEFIITQHSDLRTKLGGIKEYNELKNRITKNIDLTTKGEKINKATEELEKIATEVERKLRKKKV